MVKAILISGLLLLTSAAGPASVATVPAPPTCPPLPSNTALPVTIGNLVLSATLQTSTGPQGQIRLDAGQVEIGQPANTVGLNLTLQTGTVGDVDVVETDAERTVIRSFVAPTQTQSPGAMSLPIVTRGAVKVSLASRNHEGELMSVCAIP
jgi:hypothetical protein